MNGNGAHGGNGGNGGPRRSPLRVFTNPAQKENRYSLNSQEIGRKLKAFMKERNMETRSWNEQRIARLAKLKLRGVKVNGPVPEPVIENEESGFLGQRMEED